MFLFHTPFTTVVLFLKLYEVCEYLPMPIPETPVNVLEMEIGYWQIYICNLLFLFDLAQISTPEHCCAKPDIE